MATHASVAYADPPLEALSATCHKFGTGARGAMLKRVVFDHLTISLGACTLSGAVGTFTLISESDSCYGAPS